MKNETKQFRKQGQWVKWVIAPTLICTLLLPNGTAILFPQQQVHAVQSTKAADQAAFNRYASELNKFINGYTVFEEKIALERVKNPVKNDEAGILRNKNDYNRLVAYIDQHLPTEQSIKTRYGTDIAYIHHAFILIIESTKAFFKEHYVNQLPNDNSEEANEKVMNLLKKTIEHAEIFEAKLLNYSLTKNLDLSKESYILLHGEPSKTHHSYYKVKKGDSLSSIANRFGTTVAEIKEENNLTGNTLTVGKKLLLVVTHSKATYHIVEEEDSLNSIAYEYGLTLANLKSMNRLTSNSLKVGQELLVKKPKTVTTKTHKVKKGETLYGLSKKYKVSVAELKTLNKLTSNSLRTGQTLIYKK